MFKFEGELTKDILIQCFEKLTTCILVVISSHMRLLLIKIDSKAGGLPSASRSLYMEQLSSPLQAKICLGSNFPILCKRKLVKEDAFLLSARENLLRKVLSYPPKVRNCLKSDLQRVGYFHDRKIRGLKFITMNHISISDIAVQAWIATFQ